MENYKAPNGNWYKNQEKELINAREALDCAKSNEKEYRTIGKWLMLPAIVYLGIRAASRIYGIGPEIEPVTEIMPFTNIPDSLAATSLILGGLFKVCEKLLSIDTINAKRNLEEIETRLSNNNPTNNNLEKVIIS